MRPDTLQFDDGVYFGMPEDVYHRIGRLSNSGIHHLLIDPLEFWNWSWLNPNPPEDDTDDKFRLKGRAYHARTCEGREVFSSKYAYTLDTSDWPSEGPGALLRAAEEIKERIREINLKLPKAEQLALGGKKDELTGRLLAHDPGAQVLDILVERHTAKHMGMAMLPHEWAVDLERGAAMIEKHPVLRHCFMGGVPEVTVLWTKELETDTGRRVKVKMKSRLDYVKPEAFVDLKTFSNPLCLKLPRAVARAFAQRRYHIQAAVYYDAIDHITGFIDVGVVYKWSPEHLGPLLVNSCAESELLKSKKEKRMVFVFQQTGPSPVALGRTVDRKMRVVDIGEIEYKNAALDFAECLTNFGSDPWIVPTPLIDMTDEELPSYIGMD